MNFLVGRTGVRVPFQYMNRPFSQLTFEEACQVAKQRLEDLPQVYGNILSDRELEFVTGGLQVELVKRWTPSKMKMSPYMEQGH